MFLLLFSSQREWILINDGCLFISNVINALMGVYIYGTYIRIYVLRLIVCNHILFNKVDIKKLNIIILNPIN